MPDAGYFQRYDNLGQESASLANSANSLANTNNQLGNQRQAEHYAERARINNADEQARRRRKIENCQNHWFYSSGALQPQLWCSGGVEGRIQRQTEKLAADEAVAPALMSKEAAFEGNVAQLEGQQAHFEGQVARGHALDAERRSMFDSAVAGALTAQLHSLNASAAQWSESLAAEQTSAAALQHAAQGCAGARQGYYGAIRALHSAASTNKAAGFNNIVDGSEMIEHMQQSRRDDLMQQAQMQASQATSTLTQALASVPMGAMAQYPHLCGGLGQVVMPHLEQNGSGTAMLEIFGGDMGDAIAGQRAAQRIHQNISILGQCEQLCAHQEGMVNALLQTVRHAAANAGATLQQIKGSLAAEEQRIFDELRAACGAPAVVATAMAADAYYPMGTEVKEQLAATAMQSIWQAKHSSAPAVAVAVAVPAY